MSDLPVERKRLLNIAWAHARIDAAVDLLEEAAELLRGELESGLPVQTRPVANAVAAAKVARETLWLTLKRMP